MHSWFFWWWFKILIKMSLKKLKIEKLENCSVLREKGDTNTILRMNHIILQHIFTSFVSLVLTKMLWVWQPSHYQIISRVGKPSIVKVTKLPNVTWRWKCRCHVQITYLLLVLFLCLYINGPQMVVQRDIFAGSELASL